VATACVPAAVERSADVHESAAAPTASNIGAARLSVHARLGGFVITNHAASCAS